MRQFHKKCATYFEQNWHVVEILERYVRIFQTIFYIFVLAKFNCNVKMDGFSDIALKIGKAVRERREELSYSLEDLSRISGISVPAIRLIEIGWPEYDYRTLWMICQPMDLDIHTC